MRIFDRLHVALTAGLLFFSHLGVAEITPKPEVCHDANIMDIAKTDIYGLPPADKEEPFCALQIKEGYFVNQS